LLKLFEHWQKQDISINVTNVNRMIGVLFKMTGLTRFLNDEQKSAPALIIPNAQTSNAASIAPIHSALAMMANLSCG